MTAFTWNNPVQGDWNDANNWSPTSGPPTATDSASITGSANTTITVDSLDAANLLTATDLNAALDIDSGSGSVLSLNSGTIGLGTFTNEGTLDVTANGGVLVSSPNFTNLASNILTDGIYEVDAGADLVIQGTNRIATLDASSLGVTAIELNGVGSVMATRNPITGVTKRLEATLTTIDSGSLYLLNGRNWTSNLALTNDG